MKATGFRYYFTPLVGVLFTFPSRYWFTIGLSGVFSLGGWYRRFRTGFLWSRPTQDTATLRLAFGYAAFTPSGRPFQSVLLASHSRLRSPTTPRRPGPPRFGLFRVRSPLLGESLVYFLFLQVLRCFSSLRLPLHLGVDNWPSASWVVPFGNPWINGYLHLPTAYRSLSRPSSPPRAKASTGCT